VVGGVALALTISGTTFATGSFGILTAYWNQAYGWTQAQMAPALSVFLLCATASVPLVGLAVDRFGSRLVAIFGMAAFAAVLAAGALLHAMPSLYLFYAALGLVGAFTNPVVYLRAISQWFDRQRGLALGVAITGQGLGGAALPNVIVRIAERYGWRAALLILAGVLLFVLLPAVAVLVKDRPGPGDAVDGVSGGSGADPGAVSTQRDEGFTLAQALGERNFWLILVILGLLGLATYALSANLADLLIHVHKWTFRQTAAIGGVAGLSMVAGRVVFGWLMDRIHAPYVGAVGVLMLTAAALSFPLLHAFGPLALLWAMMTGLSTGAETDLLTLLVSRYFGNLALSRIYSWHNVTFLVGAAAGPPLFAVCVARFGGPEAALLSVAGLSALAAAILVGLGPYPQFPPKVDIIRAEIASELA
jgi:MFS family permease